MKDYLQKNPTKLEKKVEYLEYAIQEYRKRVDEYREALNSCNMLFIAICRKFRVEPEDIVGLVSDSVGNNEYSEKLLMLEKDKHLEVSDETRESINRILNKE